MSFLIDICVALLFIVLLLCLVQFFTKNNDFFKNIPGPPPLPILGNVLDFASTTKVIDTFQKYAKTYGGLCKIHLGPISRALLVTDYEFLEFVLSSTKLVTKAEEYSKFMKPWLGNGLITSSDATWRSRRKILTPAFHFTILEQFLEVFESCNDILFGKLEKLVGEKSFDVYPYMTLCALDTICEATMGVKVNAQNCEHSDYVQSVENMTRILVERAISPMQRYDFLYPLTKNFYTQRKALKILQAHSDNVIQERLKIKSKAQNSNEPEDQFGVKRRKAFLDLILEATTDGRPLTLEEIKEEVETFKFAGHETISSGMSFALYCLANHPDIQMKVFEEQQQIFGDIKEPKVTYSDLQKMKYLELVIKETLRLYPPVPGFGRKMTADVEYKGIRLPEGDSIIIFAFGIHRNPKYFDDPERFNPDRFKDLDGKLPYAYIPFSAGPRNCIGQKFAMLEMKSTLSKIIRKFELKPAVPEHVLRLTIETSLKSVNGIKIRLDLR